MKVNLKPKQFQELTVSIIYQRQHIRCIVKSKFPQANYCYICGNKEGPAFRITHENCLFSLCEKCVKKYANQLKSISEKELTAIKESLSILDEDKIQIINIVYDKSKTSYLESNKGNVIKLFCKINGLSNKDVAKAIGITEGEFSKIKNGKNTKI